MLMATRNQRILALYLEGASLAHIGRIYGLTSQRIRQILRGSDKYRRRQATKVLEPVSAEQREELSRLFNDTLMTAEKMSAATGLTKHQVYFTLGELFDSQQRSVRRAKLQRRQHAKRYTDEEIIEILRRANVEVQPSFLGIKQYSDWRDKQPDRDSLPSPNLLVQNRNSWNGWKIAAGLEVKDKEAWLGNKTFSDADCFELFDDWVKELGRFPGMEEAQKLRKPGQPSVHLIRKRFGSWEAAERICQDWQERTNGN